MNRIARWAAIWAEYWAISNTARQARYAARVAARLDTRLAARLTGRLASGSTKAGPQNGIYASTHTQACVLVPTLLLYLYQKGTDDMLWTGPCSKAQSKALLPLVTQRNGVNDHVDLAPSQDRRFSFFEGP